MSTTTDVLIIGAGPGGYVAAIRLGQLGKKVILVEKARVGGICLNLGCIPTKALLHAVQIRRGAKEGEQLGMHFAEPEIDITRLADWRDRIVSRLVRGVEYLLRANRVETVHAQAEFIADRKVQLIRQDGDTLVVEPENIIIATGAEPALLPELNSEQCITSDEAVMLRTVPKQILIVGAGAIGLEFATIYSALGATVTVVEVMDQVLPGVDRELATLLERSLRRQGIQVLLKTRVAEIAVDRAVVVSSPQSREPVQQEIVADKILVAVGRRPLTRGLGLERTGIHLTAKGFIEVNEQLETSVPGVFAIGDVARPPMLAHKASREGVVVAERIAGRRRDSLVALRAVPNCVFTEPELAVVGVSEVEAAAAGYEPVVGRVPITALGRAATVNRSEGICKIVADRKTDRVLGVHILAPEASSLIGEAALAIECGLTVKDIAGTIHPHPTFGELLMETAAAVHHEAIHIPGS